MNRSYFHATGRAARLVLLFACLLHAGWPPEAAAQERVPQRQVRTYVPPDQLVSFLPTTPFNQFIQFQNTIFRQVTGKTIVDPESRKDAIGIAVAGMQFFDAFELVLEYNQLTYRETDQFFIIEAAPTEPDLHAETPGTLPAPAPSVAAAKEVLATPQTREVQIDAILFDLNLNQARQLGIDWNVLFGNQQSSTGTSGGSGGTSDQQRPRFFVRTDKLFENFDEYLIAPSQIDVSILTQLFRLLETEGAGQTLANPSVTVQSAEQGRIQIGSDIPVTVRDFAGNTITQFVSTGIIINVTPTLITAPIIDTTNAPLVDFIHLDVQVERSNGRPFGDAVAIDRNTATTQVLLLPGEQTIIGGLYSTDITTVHRGIPILKDLPPWFFGLRYLFGYESKIATQRELLIVLQAKLQESIPNRLNRPLPDELLEKYRQRVYETLDRFDEDSVKKLPAQQKEARKLARQ